MRFKKESRALHLILERGKVDVIEPLGWIENIAKVLEVHVQLGELQIREGSHGHCNRDGRA